MPRPRTSGLPVPRRVRRTRVPGGRLRAMSTPPEVPEDVGQDLLARGLPRRRGAGHVDLPGAAAAAAAAPRGRGRRRQDRGGEGARPRHRRRAAPAPVLRGHRRRPGGVRVGLRPPAAAPARRRGHGCAERRGDRRRRGRAVQRAVPRPPAPAAGPGGVGRRRPARPADRRGRPGRRRVRGVPAGDPLRLGGHDPRARHVPRRGPAGRRDHVEPHPRRPRRPEAALPLPLGRAPDVRARGRDRPAAGPRGRRRPRPPGRRPRSPSCASAASTSRPASPRRSTGSRPCRPSVARPSTTPRWTPRSARS